MRFKVSLLLILLFLLSNTSCGWLDNDETTFKKNIVGNIELHKQQNSDSYNLVLVQTEEMSAGIVNNCTTIYYDSLNKTILLECYLNKYNTNYIKITILNSTSKRINDAIKIKKIDKVKYDNIDKKLMNKIFSISRN